MTPEARIQRLEAVLRWLIMQLVRELDSTTTARLLAELEREDYGE